MFVNGQVMQFHIIHIVLMHTFKVSLYIRDVHKSFKYPSVRYSSGIVRPSPFMLNVLHVILWIDNFP